jgi:hypothetical protein
MAERFGSWLPDASIEMLVRPTQEVGVTLSAGPRMPELFDQGISMSVLALTEGRPSSLDGLL